MQNYIFDLDGTLITDGKPLERPLAQSLEHLLLGANILFASARPVRDMLPLLPASLQGCVMVGCNGGMAWQRDACLFSHQFTPAVAQDIVAFLRNNAIPYVLDGRWSFAVSAVSHPFHRYMRTLSDHEIPEAELLHDGVAKILILDGAARTSVDDFLAGQGYRFNLYHHKSDNLFDITPQKENKYQALLKLGIDVSASVVFGNDANDFAMLDHAHTSVFAGDADDYPQASYYCRTAELPALLAQLSGRDARPLRAIP